MRKFIEINFTWHQISHVIYFDNKPMCLATANLKSPEKQPMDFFWIKGWKAFKKNEHLFPHPNFIFSCNIEESEVNWKSISLFIFNKTALEKCLNNHLKLFQNILGQDFSTEWLIGELESQRSVYEILKNDERLLGILLGYGEESAIEYYRQSNSSVGIPNHTNEYCPIEAKTPKGCTLYPVVIMGNPNSKEAQSLIATYEQELDEFWSIYRREDPLELFLKCICGEKSG